MIRIFHKNVITLAEIVHGEEEKIVKPAQKITFFRDRVSATKNKKMILSKLLLNLNNFALMCIQNVNFKVRLLICAIKIENWDSSQGAL
jgi:hypothetical protein